MQGELRFDDPLTLLLWLGCAVMIYGCIAGVVSYVQNVRVGNRIVAAQGKAQAVIALIGLVALRVLHYYYLTG